MSPPLTRPTDDGQVAKPFAATVNVTAVATGRSDNSNPIAQRPPADRRGLEQWLAREVAVRTHDLEGRVAAIESIVLDLLAGTADGPAVDAALTQLARELGVSRDDVVAEVKRRRA